MSHGLPPNPMRGVPPAAGPAISPPPPRREPLPFEERSPYARAPPPLRPDYPPPPRDDDRGRGWGRGREELDDRWSDRGGGWGEERDRRPPPPRWEDEYDRPKRRRSPSPFGPSHRQRMHSPSPPPPPARFQLPDPADLPHSLTYRQFADWFRASHPQTAKQDEEELRRYKQEQEEGRAVTKERVGMAKRYERYRKEYTSRQLFGLYLTHRDSPWFQERYAISSDFFALRRRVNRQGRVPTVQKYIDQLRAGEHDSASYELPSENERNGSSSRNGQAEPEGLDRALGDAPIDTDPLRVEVPPTQRQVFVKTVPPGTGRKSLEALFKRAPGFQYLALTEPAVKKSFHRVGWAQYAEGVDVKDVVTKLDNSKVDNFTFHLGVNGTPVVGRVRLTAPSANTLDRLLRDGEKAKQLAEKLEEELLGDDEDEVAGGSADGQEAGPSSPESKEASVPGLSEKGSKFVQEKIDQLCEDAGLEGELDAEQQTRKAKIALDQWLGYLRHGLSTCYYCVASQAFPEELHRKCISHMRPHPSTVSESSDHVENQDEREERMDEERVGRGEDDESRRDERDSKADREAPKPTGGKIPNHLKSEDERWAEGLDTKLRAVLDPDVNVVDYGGRDLDEESLKICGPAIKQEEASKYRCTHCSKLFKAPEFVVKHIASKHPEELKPKLDKFIVFNNYILDPQRLQPGATNLAAVNDELPLPPAMSDFTFGVPPLGMPAFDTRGTGGAGGVPGQFDERMMQQQMMMMMSMQQMMMANMGMGGAGGAGALGMGGMGMGMGAVPMGGAGGREGRNGARRQGGGASSGGAVDVDAAGPPPGGEDPRARKGRVSYQDLDSPGGAGDGGLPY